MTRLILCELDPLTDGILKPITPSTSVSMKASVAPPSFLMNKQGSTQPHSAQTVQPAGQPTTIVSTWRSQYSLVLPVSPKRSVTLPPAASTLPAPTQTLLTTSKPYTENACIVPNVQMQVQPLEFPLSRERSDVVMVDLDKHSAMSQFLLEQGVKMGLKLPTQNQEDGSLVVPPFPPQRAHE